MASLQVEVQPLAEPVTLDMAKAHLRVTITDDDALISGYISAARDQVERILSRSLINKGYRESYDSFPYFTDTVMSQMAYPPSYYSLPRYSTTLWNYSQMIKLFYSPLVSVEKISYLSSGDGAWHDLIGASILTWNPNIAADFVYDPDSEPPRIFPLPGQNWPSVLYVPNAVRIHYTAGYGDDDTKVPQLAKLAVLETVASWYAHREGVSPVEIRAVPGAVMDFLWALRVMDVAPTRG